MYHEEKYILPSLFADDTLSASDISTVIIKMKRLNDLKKKYQNSIKTRKDGKLFYIYVNRKQISSSTEEGLYEKLYELEYGRLTYSINDIFKEFMCWKRDYTSSSPKTLREYTILWNNTIQNTLVTKKPICELTRKDFLEYFRIITKDRNLTRKQFNNIKSVLNGIMNYAMEQDIISHNPIKDIDCKQFSYKPINRKNEVITIEERQKLLEYLENDYSICSLAIQFDFCMVLRIGELLALKWSDIEGEYIHIQRQRLIDNEMNDDLTFTSRNYNNAEHVKGYTEQGFRYMPLTSKAKNILLKAKELNPNGEYIFMNNGRQISYDAFNRKLKKACSKVSISSYSSHKIRFSSASILYENGMPLTSLQGLLGHTTTAMTLHYIRPVTPLEKTTEIMCNSLG